MKYILILIVFGLIFQITKAQLIFKIEDLCLSNYNTRHDNNIIDENTENGPYAYFKCLIINNTKDSITLNHTKSNSQIFFRYNKLDYVLDVDPFAFMDNKKLVIPPKDTIDFSFGSHLLLGTNIFNHKQGNYTDEMIKILPTLKIVYQSEGIKIYTDEIKNIILK